MAETIIEIAGPKQENVMFGPTGEKLRGRWSHTAAAGFTIHESLASLHRAAPEIPGVCLGLDPQSRRARRFDPLSCTDEGRAVWAAMEPVIQDYEFFFGKFRPGNEKVYEDLSDTDLKTWAWDMRNLLDCGLARQVSGPLLPTCKEIEAKPGDRCVKSYGQSYGAGRLPVDEYGNPVRDDKGYPVWKAPETREKRPATAPASQPA